MRFLMEWKLGTWRKDASLDKGQVKKPEEFEITMKSSMICGLKGT